MHVNLNKIDVMMIPKRRTRYLSASCIIIVASIIVVIVLFSLSIGLGVGLTIAKQSKLTSSPHVLQKAAICDMADFGSNINWTCTNNVPEGDICEWEGVGCNQNLEVSHMDISTSDIDYQGPIPTSIGYLSSLTYLALSSYPSYSNINGTIPTSIGYLSKLEYLYLYRNKLTGTLPTSLQHLSSLRVLSLHRNQLSGSIPSALGKMSSIEAFSLSNNKLTGTIPSSLGFMMYLEKMFLWNNNLSGSVPYTLCTSGTLTDLEINNNPLMTCYHDCLSTVQLKYYGSLTKCDQSEYNK